MSASGESSESRPSSRGDHSWGLSPGGKQSQLDFDIQFFDRVLVQQPDYIDVLRCQGQLLARKGLYDRALEVDRRLVGLLPSDSVAHYNLACSLALSCQRREAIAALESALKHGYDDFEYLDTDSDLDSLRETPEFQALLKKFGGSN